MASYCLPEKLAQPLTGRLSSLCLVQPNRSVNHPQSITWSPTYLFHSANPSLRGSPSKEWSSPEAPHDGCSLLSHLFKILFLQPRNLSHPCLWTPAKPLSPSPLQPLLPWHPFPAKATAVPLPKAGLLERVVHTLLSLSSPPTHSETQAVPPRKLPAKVTSSVVTSHAKGVRQGSLCPGHSGHQAPKPQCLLLEARSLPTLQAPMLPSRLWAAPALSSA